MRIRHKASKYTYEVSLRDWQNEYLINHKYHNYDIIAYGDIVELYKINEVKGRFSFNMLIDKNAGVSIVRKEPKKFMIKDLRFKRYDRNLILNVRHKPRPSSKEEIKVEPNTSDSIMDKLKKQLERARSLKYEDEVTKNDIVDKLKMYLDLMFPSSKATLYSIHLINISFKPMYAGNFVPQGQGQEAWDKGVKELINFIETRIEEYEIIESKKTKTMAKDKAEPAKITLRRTDGKKIDLGEALNELNTTQDELKIAQDKIEELQKKNAYWNTGKVSLALLVMGGAFTLGLYFGNNKFDKDKIDLVEINRELVNANEDLENEKKVLSDKVELLEVNQIELAKFKDSIQALDTMKPIKPFK